jgi:hypothetical protein
VVRLGVDTKPPSSLSFLINSSSGVKACSDF